MDRKKAGFVDHIGLGVPDLAAAREYYDDLLAVLGMRPWFGTGPDGPVGYGPDGALGSQVFLYESTEAGSYSRHRPGLHHLAFAVADRAIVREAYAWAVARGDEILHTPREFPEYGTHYATYWLDPRGFKLEVVCHQAAED